KAIGERIVKTKEQVGTEEATKNAFVMPFISSLGYDVFNPLEVVPEYTADVGIKKGEKVDYCIIKEGSPIIIVECKHWREKLTNHNSQLHRYFHVTNARFAILTNGIKYRVYTDLEAKNKMDSHPFLEFDMIKVDEVIAGELKRFQKDNFDEDEIFNVASDLKYSKHIKELLYNELKSPSEDFIKYFASRIYLGRVTSKVLEQFGGLMQSSVKSLLGEMINERLQLAITKQDEQEEQEMQEEEIIEVINQTETTEEELQGFRIVQAILMQDLDSSRVAHRDTKSYFGILLDDNSRKPICRLWLNRSQKYVGLFDSNKKEERMPIDRLEDIYNYADNIRATVKHYEA
ncbi:MAG: type I restriction endonuclease, partial [Bacteroidota bacterium]